MNEHQWVKQHPEPPRKSKGDGQELHCKAIHVNFSLYISVRGLGIGSATWETSTGCEASDACVQVVYSEFLDLVRSGNVKQARIDESLQKVYFSVEPRTADQQDPAAVASTSGKPPAM